MPVLPLVGSTIVEPGLTRPCCSAASSIASAIRSLTLPPGFSDSSLATTLAPHGPQDVTDADLLGPARQVIAARGAALRAEHPGALQRQEDVLQVALRDRLPPGDVLDRHEPLPAADRQIQHRLDRILALRRDSHRSARARHAPPAPVDGGRHLYRGPRGRLPPGVA